MKRAPEDIRTLSEMAIRRYSAETAPGGLEIVLDLFLPRIPDEAGRDLFRQGFILGFLLSRAEIDLGWRREGYIDPRTASAKVLLGMRLSGDEMPFEHAQLLGFALDCGLYYGVQGPREAIRELQTLRMLAVDTFGEPHNAGPIGWIARGWIEDAVMMIWEGAFDAGSGKSERGITFVREVVFQPASLDPAGVRRIPWSNLAGAPARVKHIPWSDVNWVALEPRSSYPPGLAETHADILASSTDPNVVSGALSGTHGQVGAEMFGLIGDTDRSGVQWIEMFRAAGVEVKR